MKEQHGPSRLLLKQAESLFPDPEEREAFVDALVAGQSRQQAIIVLQDKPEIQTFPRQWPLAWQPPFVVRVAEHFRPGKHPLFAKGAYYSLDFSSIFSASALQAISTPPRTVLDLCASPGGKAIFAWRQFQPELLVCNESVRKRMPSLISNLARCKIERSIVWSADPSVWSKRFPQTFELIIVDAPCSGQSLLAKGDKAPGAFSPQMIDMCVGRQRRIMGHAAQCLRPGGHILYATCTYAYKENEKVIAWLLEEYPELEAVEVPFYEEFQSRYAEFPCYRLFPMSGLGAGAFVCLLRHTGEPPAHQPVLDEIPASWRYGDPAPLVPGAAPPEEGPTPFEVPKAKRVFHKRPRKPVPYNKKPRRGRRS